MQFARDATHWRMLFDLLMLGVFGGFYIVPLYALIQTRSDPAHRSRIIAGNNILNAVFMVAAAAMAIGLFAAGLAGLGAFVADHGTWRVMADLFLLALFAGFYSVPLYALIQTRSDAAHRSRIIAGNNILNAVFMVAAAALAIGLFAAGLTIPQLILVTALLNAAIALYIYLLVPEFLMRFIVWMLIHSVYRLDKRGLEHIPEEGPALIVCNHVSFVDALIIAAASRRPVRFVMDYRVFRLPVVSFVFRTGKAIPIAPAKEDAAMMERAFAEVAKALREGDLVAIFPEGRITDTGEMVPFRPGLKRILAETPVPVVPMALRGLWGSYFSRMGGAAMSRPWRARPFAKIGLAVGAPLAAVAATPEGLQSRVQELRGEWR